MNILKNKTFRRILEAAVHLLPDALVVRLQYRVLVGRWPNLKKPRRFTEKIVWYKLHYRIPLMTQCVDKYREKFYLKDKGFEEYIPKTLQVCDKIESVDFDKLPNAFIIKCNNGYGNNVIVRDKSVLDKHKIFKIFNGWHSTSPVVFGREWAFKDVRQQILVEELLVSKDGTQKGDLNDYKIMCFNGEPKVIWADIDRYTKHRRNFYDLNWNKLSVESDCPNTDYEVTAPYGLSKMIEIASIIAKDFPFVRVDFYSVNNKVYIGELTFYPWSGCVNYKPTSFDFELGNMFVLPKPTC